MKKTMMETSEGDEMLEALAELMVWRREHPDATEAEAEKANQEIFERGCRRMDARIERNFHGGVNFN